MTDNNHADLRQGIVDTCREMNRNGLNQGTSGNLSHRIPNGMLITPTSLPYDRMQYEEIVAMDFAANYQGNHRPSSEWAADVVMASNNRYVEIGQATPRLIRSTPRAR
jgi:L-fuculose-phosphate aldolase